MRSSEKTVLVPELLHVYKDYISSVLHIFQTYFLQLCIPHWSSCSFTEGTKPNVAQPILPLHTSHWIAW